MEGIGTLCGTLRAKPEVSHRRIHLWCSLPRGDGDSMYPDQPLADLSVANNW